MCKSTVYIKKYCLNFQSIQGSFFNFFLFFSIYKVTDSEYSMDVYKFVKTSIGIVILKFVPDHLKTKTMYKHAIK